MRLFRRKPRLTTEEDRLAEHTAMMGRVQGDIIIKPIPFVTVEEYEQAYNVKKSCTSCGTYMGQLWGVCAECRLADSKMFDSSGPSGLHGLPKNWSEHIPIGVEVVQNEWFGNGLCSKAILKAHVEPLAEREVKSLDSTPHEPNLTVVRPDIVMAPVAYESAPPTL